MNNQASTYDPVFSVQPPGGESALHPDNLRKNENRNLVTMRHPEWVEHQVRWRFLLDSLEGGERYRQAIYGFDLRGMPVRNLVRHKREYPSAYQQSTISPYLNAPVGADPLMPATDDDYELRRARTPVPTFVPESVSAYLGRIFGRKVERKLPASPIWDQVRKWWRNVDGRRTAIDNWLQDRVFPILLACGTVDILACHPAVPKNETITSHHDELRLNLRSCICKVILPQNVCYWELDGAGDYTLALVQEWSAGGDSDPRYLMSQSYTTLQFDQPQSSSGPTSTYRLWLPDRWILYDGGGKKLAEQAHPFGRVPIVRLMYRPKPRCENVGASPFEAIAERQREFQNKDSELILSDTLQAHPLLQAPEDILQPDGQIQVGPGNLLPKKKFSTGSGYGYESFEVVEFPKGGAESIRLNKSELRESVDRDASLMKPAGADGTTGGTVGQSGIAKEIDNESLHDRLTLVAGVLETCERRILGLVTVVLTDGDPPELDEPDGDPVAKIAYPRTFSLRSADQVASLATEFQSILAAGGNAPLAEKMFLSDLFRKAMPGHEDQVYDEVDAEIEAFLNQAQADREQIREALPPDQAALAQAGLLSADLNFEDPAASDPEASKPASDSTSPATDTDEDKEPDE